MSWNSVADQIRRATDPDHQILRLFSMAAKSAGVKFDERAHGEMVDAMKAYAFDKAFCGGFLGTEDNLNKKYKKVLRSQGLSSSEAKRYSQALSDVLGIIFD